MCVCEKVMCDEEMDGGFLQLRAKEFSATFSTFMKDSVFLCVRLSSACIVCTKTLLAS